LEIQLALSTLCLHMNQKGHVACNFNYLFETNEFSRSQPVTYTVNVVIYR